jgi:hypothetical protein
VGIKNITIQSFEANKEYVATIFYQSYGRIPALDLKIFASAEGHTIATYEISKYGKTMGSAAILPPSEGLNATVLAGGQLSAQEIENFRTKRMYLYVFGMISYTDVFGGKDTATFCHICDFADKTFSAGAYFNKMK